MIWTVAFWKGAVERLIKTVAQTLAAIVATDAVGIMDVDWRAALSVAALAGVASLLTSIGNADFTAGAQAVVIELDSADVARRLADERTIDLSPPVDRARVEDDLPPRL